MVFFVCWWLLHLFYPSPFFMIGSLSWWDVMEGCKQADAVDVYANVWQLEGNIFMEGKKDISTTYKGCIEAFESCFLIQDWKHDMTTDVSELILGYLASQSS